MFRLLSQGPASCFWKLFAREFIQPTKAFDVMMSESIMPSYHFLMDLLGGIIAPDSDELTFRLCAASIVGQCLYYRNSREVIRRITGREQFGVEEIEAIADHITRFSLNAMLSCYGKGIGRP
jgi:hypothetical protein